MDQHLPSRIRRLPNGRRQGHLMTLMGTDWDGWVYLSDIYISAGSFLAVKHLNERSGAVLPDLPALMEGCDFDFTFSQRETNYNPHVAVEELVDATTGPSDELMTSPADNEQPKPPIVEMIWEDENNHEHALNNNNVSSTRTRALAHPSDSIDQDTSAWQHPFAAVGAAYSYVTIPLTIVASALEMPVLSGSATSTELDDKPLFGRTIPTNSGDARAALLYYDSIGITRVACIYINDSYGLSYHSDLRKERAQNFAHIDILSYPYDEGEEETALEQLKASGYHYVYAIVRDWKPMLAAAYDLGVVANKDYSWITAELVEWTQDFALNRTDYDFIADPEKDDPADIPEEYKWKHALNGIGQLGIHVPEHEAFQAALHELSTNETIRNDYINSFHQPEAWAEEEWTPAGHSIYANMNYDAMIALGLAACRTPGLFTGSELYDTLRTLEFEGTTGHVQFDPITLNRQVDSVQYRVDNIFLSEERSDEDFVGFDSNLVALVGDGSVTHLNTWQHYDNTTLLPLEIPPVAHFEYNLVPTWAHVFGLALAAFVMLMSLGWIAWAYYYRNLSVVKASQPVFLCQLCVGTLVMSSAIIPMSFQGTEESFALDFACMSIPWLVICGFVTALSGLFSKAWRLNKLIGSGMQMRRIQVEPRDVIWPYVLFMTINVALLIGWTVVSPWKYIREAKDFNVDSFGRSVESYGSCQSEDKNLSLAFLIPIAVVNFVGLCLGAYQSFQGRNLPTAFSESSYLAISMASLLESLLLGGPIMLVVQDDPTALYTVGAALICISCLTILLPVFLPKYLSQRNAGAVNNSMMSSMVSRRNLNADRSGSLVSGVGTGSHVSNHMRTSMNNHSQDDATCDGSVKSASTAHSANSWGRMSIKRNGPDGAAASQRRLFASPAPSRINRSQISSTKASEVSEPFRQSVQFAPNPRSHVSSINSTPSNDSMAEGPSVKFAPDTKG